LDSSWFSTYSLSSLSKSSTPSHHLYQYMCLVFAKFAFCFVIWFCLLFNIISFWIIIIGFFLKFYPYLIFIYMNNILVLLYLLFYLLVLSLSSCIFLNYHKKQQQQQIRESFLDISLKSCIFEISQRGTFYRLNYIIDILMITVLIFWWIRWIVSFVKVLFHSKKTCKWVWY